MASQMPTTPTNEGNVAVARKTDNSLARLSFLLAVIPIVLGVVVLVWYMLSIQSSDGVPDLTAVGSTFSVLYLLSHATSISAIVTGSLALRRARQYPAPQSGRAWSAWGRGLGIAEITISLCADVLGVLLVLVFASELQG
jgi:hypothetical protein